MTDPPPASTSAQAGSPRRLRTIGLQPRQDRSTVLCTLAGELPAAILAQPLGNRIKHCRRLGCDRAGYGRAGPPGGNHRPSSECSPPIP
jgi:hypothetical protein